ncbi:MAG: hypothetical protein EXS18_02175 [Verrucomicrobiae bacterium]|nr:hypothetical protein [Verrucomicrobiae bacterium]
MWCPSKTNVIGAIAVAALTQTLTSRACGPDFPNQLLLMGDRAVLEAPVANFRLEIERIKPSTKPQFTAIAPDGQGVIRQTYDADMVDLESAVRQLKISTNVIREYAEVRGAIRQFLTDQDQWDGLWHYDWTGDEPVRVHDGNQPKFPTLIVPNGLPAEFADYLDGAIRFHQGQPDAARQEWNRLLDRPKEQRRYRSTWACFMIGKTYLGSDPAKAIASFQSVRELAKDGFADSLGLAAASIGWEARAELDRKNYERAIELYFDHYATGDPSAVVSLENVAGRIYRADPPILTRFARHKLARELMTAYLISRHNLPDHLMDDWLAAVENAGATDVDGADRMAWAAYQSGDADAAWRWLNRARGKSAVALWVKAKLLLHDGRASEASALLAKLIRLFPNEQDWFGAYKPSEGYSWRYAPAVREVGGELAVLHLARGQYVDALDLLLRTGYWVDAAYVAERILTADELLAYVKRTWPEKPIAETTENNTTDYEWGRMNNDQVPEQIRYLLARRLVRIGRLDEAQPFFPPDLKLTFHAYSQAMKHGRDANLPAMDRAEWLWEAARITRYWGLALTGTEVEPDWHAYGGSYDLGNTSESRPKEAEIVPVTEVERQRVGKHVAEPDERFHYRYRAADLAWEAARLLPDDSDATAAVLCEAGSWLKIRNPMLADRFYKSLVVRCRHTETGAEADRRRWFPGIDQPERPDTIH